MSKSRVAFVLLLTTTAALIGCATVDRNTGLSDVDQAVSQRIGKRIHWNQGTVQDGAVETTIRSILQRQMTVDDAVQVALLNNPSLQATYEELGIAQSDLVEAGLLQNPRFDFNYKPAIADGSGTEIEFTVVQNFLSIAFLPLRKKVASEAFERAKLQVANEVIDVVHEVRAAFYTLQAHQQVLEMERNALLAMEASAEFARRLHDAGNITDLALANERAAYMQVKVGVARMELEVGNDREELNQLLGLWGGDTTWTIADRLDELPPADPSLEHLESLAVAQRLDLEAARREAQALEQAFVLAKQTSPWMDFDLGIAGKRESDGLKLLGPEISAEIPIFNQGQTRIARAESELRQSQQRLRKLAVRVRSQVRVARTRLVTARDIASFYRSQLLPLRQTVTSLSQEQYNGMLIGVFELLQAKQAEIASGREYIEALRDYWVAYAELEHAVGGRLPLPALPESDQEAVPVTPSSPQEPQHQHHQHGGNQ